MPNCPFLFYMVKYPKRGERMKQHITLSTLGFYFFFYGGLVVFPPIHTSEGFNFKFVFQLFIQLIFIGIGLLCLIYRQNELKFHSKHFMIKKLYRHEIIITLLIFIIIFIPNFLALPIYYILGALQFLWYLKWITPLEIF